MKDLFESKQSIEILIVLLEGKMMITNIMKSIFIEYGKHSHHSSISKCVNFLEKLGLVRKEIAGRKCNISLTPKGESIAKLLKNIRNELA